MSALVAACTLASAALAAPNVVAAQDAASADGAAGASLDKEARSLFEAGETAYQDGRFEAALEYFQRAYALSDRPRLLYNIAQAADRLRRDDEALQALRTYRERLPDAPNRAQVDARIRALEARRDKAAATATTPAPEAPTDPAPTAEPLAEPTPAPEPSPLDQDLHAAARGPAPADDGGGGVLSEWWFWAGAGVVVAAIAVGVVVASSSDGGEAPRARGTDGMVIVTLTTP